MTISKFIHLKGSCQVRLVAVSHLGVLPPVYFYFAIEVHRDGVLWSRELPAVAKTEPVVRQLHLERM